VLYNGKEQSTFIGQMPKINIIGNCQLSRIKPLPLKLLPDLTVDFIISYENLNPPQKVIKKIQNSELLVVQPVKNYTGLRIEEINTMTGGQVPIIRVPFLRFHGFWEQSECCYLSSIGIASCFSLI
jgi:hypothetical protein